MRLKDRIFEYLKTGPKEFFMIAGEFGLMRLTMLLRTLDELIEGGANGEK